MQIIQIINRTKRIRDARFEYALPCWQFQITEQFAPKWGIDYRLEFVARTERPDPRHWQLWMFDNSDEAGALGYHDFRDGQVTGKVFVEDDIRTGSEISVTVAHELIEMGADPYISRLSDPIDGWQYAIEPCDAVEADLDGPMITVGSSVIRGTNFCCPWYYRIPNADGSQDFDFMGKLSRGAPDMTAGGYQLRTRNAGQSWQTMAQRYEDGTLSQRAYRAHGRSAMRAAGLVPAAP